MNYLPLAPTRFEKMHPATTYMHMLTLADANRQHYNLPKPVRSIPSMPMSMPSMPPLVSGLKAPKTFPNYGMAHPLRYKMKTYEEEQYTD